MTKTTAAERLAPLLEWTTVDQEIEDWNEDHADRLAGEYHKRMSSGEVRRRLRAFVDSFAGEKVSAAKVTAMLPSEWPPTWFPRSVLRVAIPAKGITDITPEEIAAVRVEELRLRLSSLLTGDRIDLPLSRLSYRVDRAKGLLVSGPLYEVVLYLAAWLVVEYGIVIAECEAPMADVPGRHERDWATWPRCQGLLVAGGRGSGHRYCSKACKRRAKNPNWKKRLKKEKR